MCYQRCWPRPEIHTQQINDEDALSVRRKRSPSPKLPEGLRIYAVGDIHGCADLLEDVVARIDKDRRLNPAARDLEIYLGDFIDRGRNSREVLDLLLRRREMHETILLKGNHETYLLEFLNAPRRSRTGSILAAWRHCRPMG